MRILMLQSSAREQHAGIDQGLDHRLVGVALLAFVGEHALAGKAWRLLGETAVGIDGVGNGGVDALRGEITSIGSPNIKVFAAMSRRGVDKACSDIFGDVFSPQEWHLKVVVVGETVQGMRTNDSRKRIG